jgi:hypothetical protein
MCKMENDDFIIVFIQKPVQTGNVQRNHELSQDVNPDNSQSLSQLGLLGFYMDSNADFNVIMFILYV